MRNTNQLAEDLENSKRDAVSPIATVSDVIALSPEQIKRIPEMCVALNSEYLTGLETIGERIIILLDIDLLMSSLALYAADTLAA